MREKKKKLKAIAVQTLSTQTLTKVLKSKTIDDDDDHFVCLSFVATVGLDRRDGKYRFGGGQTMQSKATGHDAFSKWRTKQRERERLRQNKKKTQKVNATEIAFN